MNPETKPKYVNARSVSQALRKDVQFKLERIKSEGIISVISLVEFSKWAAPIVPVAKLDGTVRIFGDYN